MPTCRELGIGIIAYGPMSRGLLTGTVSLEGMGPTDFRRHASPQFSAESMKTVRLALCLVTCACVPSYIMLLCFLLDRVRPHFHGPTQHGFWLHWYAMWNDKLPTARLVRGITYVLISRWGAASAFVILCVSWWGPWHHLALISTIATTTCIHSCTRGQAVASRCSHQLGLRSVTCSLYKKAFTSI